MSPDRLERRRHSIRHSQECVINKARFEYHRHDRINSLVEERQTTAIFDQSVRRSEFANATRVTCSLGNIIRMKYTQRG